MYRVVTKHFDQYGRWVVEPGPWHVSRSDADNWASILQYMGYKTEVESQFGGIVSANSEGDELRNALASMA